MMQARLTTVLLVVAVFAGACATERVITSDGRAMPPKPRGLRAAPAGAAANYMLLRCETTRDANGNGYPDTLPIVTALMHQPQFATMEASGVFVFTLWRRGDAMSVDRVPIREWRLEGDALRRALMYDSSGVFYRFRLNLLDSGTDRVSAVSADLRGRYQPVSGDAVYTSDEPRSVQIGRGRVVSGDATGGAPR